MRQWCPPFPFPFLMSLLVCVSYLALIAVSPQRNCLDAAITVCSIPPCQKITFPSSGFLVVVVVVVGTSRQPIFHDKGTVV